MRLRELFEATANEVAIIFGRFNPPHKGHRAAWELASQSSAWFVGTNESTVGPKDPLPYEIKVEAMKAIWPEVEGHIMAETSWLTMASELYKKYPEATLLCLTDEDWVTKTIVQYNGKEGAHGFYNFKDIKQKPTPRLSSATALRDAVTKGDREAFAQAAGVPADTPVAGKPFFDLVAEYLLPYANAPKKVAKKKVAEISKATIDRYVTKASDSHGDADFKARMSKNDPDKRSYHVDQKKTAEKRRQGISRALDRMSREESIEEYGDTAKGQKMLTKVQKRAVDRVVSKKADTDPKYAKKNQQTANRAWDRMIGVDEATSVAVRLQRAADKQRAKSDASLARTPSSIPKKDQEKKNG